MRSVLRRKALFFTPPPEPEPRRPRRAKGAGMEKSIAEIKRILAESGFSFKRGLGQNFLINPSVCPKMADLCGCAGIGALEIGPGAGVLTAELCARAAKTVAIELDRGLGPVLARTLGEREGLRLIFADARKLDLGALIDREFGSMPVAVCANLPYYISTELIMKLLELGPRIRSVTVMLQKELAVRLCAEPGTRESGAVSAAVRYRSVPRTLFDVSAGSFYPAPKVDSRVICLKMLDEPAVRTADESLFFRTVRAAFGQRRKTLLNSLSSEFPRDSCALALEKAGISPSARAEQLTLREFGGLSDALSSLGF